MYSRDSRFVVLAPGVVVVVGELGVADHHEALAGARRGHAEPAPLGADEAQALAGGAPEPHAVEDDDVALAILRRVDRHHGHAGEHVEAGDHGADHGLLLAVEGGDVDLGARHSGALQKVVRDQHRQRGRLRVRYRRRAAAPRAAPAVAVDTRWLYHHRHARRRLASPRALSQRL
jgi:hypothetical protein